MSQEPTPLHPESMLQQAREQTGLSDFGPMFWWDGLRALCDTYLHTLQLRGKAALGQERRLVGLLANRLRIIDTFRQHPEIRELELKQPLILTGFPRTGTSALFNLLASHPAHRPLLLWEGNHPDPPQEPFEGEDPRLIALRQMLERVRERSPEFSAIHEASADGPEECVQLMAHSIAFVQLGFEPLFPPYRDAFRAVDRGELYREYAEFLRLLHWQRPGERWLLKTPAHLWGLAPLVHELPDVCLVFTHRDPLECVPSYCSMMSALMGGPDRMPSAMLGPIVLDYLAASMDAALDDRERIGDDRFLDVAYRSFLDEPLRTATDIHERFGLELSEEARRRYAAHVEAHPQNRHGRHRYDLESFGLSEGMILDRLARYRDRFGAFLG